MRRAAPPSWRVPSGLLQLICSLNIILRKYILIKLSSKHVFCSVITPPKRNCHKKRPFYPQTLEIDKWTFELALWLIQCSPPCSPGLPHETLPRLPVSDSPHLRCSETLPSLNRTLPALLQEAASIKPHKSLAIHTLCIALTLQPCANATLLIIICSF